MDARVCSSRPASLSQTCRYMRGVSGVSIGEQAQVRRAPDIFHGRRDGTFFASYIPLLVVLSGALDAQGLALFWMGVGSALLYLAGGLVGGWFGGKLSAEAASIESHGTVAGIRWGHLFWILPFIGYPWLASLSLAVYFALAMFVAELYYLFHPSLWLNITWWIFFAVTPVLLVLTFAVIASALTAFISSMHHSKRNGRLSRVLLYGLGAPVLSWFLASVGVMTVHRMPKPIAGDWKIGVALSLGLASLAVIVTTTQRIARFIRERGATRQHEKDDRREPPRA